MHHALGAMLLIHIFLLLHQCVVVIIIIDGQVAIFITEIVDSAGFSSVGIRVVIKIKTLFTKFIAVCFRLSMRIEFHEDPSVLPEDVIDVANVVVPITVELVIIDVSTLIRAEFLINSTKYFRLTS